MSNLLQRLNFGLRFIIIFHLILYNRMLHYFTINTTVETVCFFIAFFCLIKDTSAAWRSIVLFLLITCVAEMTGIYCKALYLSDRAHIHPNAWVYNILIIFQACFFSLMYHHLFSKFIKNTSIIIGGLALLTFIYIYELFSHGFFVYVELTNTTLSVILVLYSLYYYYCLIKDNAFVNLKRSPEFWWVTGVLFFYFGTTVFNIFYEQLTEIMINTKHDLKYLKYFHNIFNVILYGFWSYSFICKKWMTTKPKY